MVTFPADINRSAFSPAARPAFSAAQSVRGGAPIRFAAALASPPATSSKLIDDEIYNLIRALPKATLHEHLGGSTDMALYKSQLLREGEREGLDADALRERLRLARANEYGKTHNTHDLHDDEAPDSSKPPVAGKKTGGLKDHAKKYDENNGILHTKMIENAYLASYLYTLKAARENVRYFELRTNPNPGKGTPEELIKFIQQGIEDAQDELDKSREKVDYGIILLAYRHGDTTVDPATNRMVKVNKALEVADNAIDLRKKGYPVVAIDLAGDELDCPVTDFKPVFDKIHRYNARMVAQGKPDQRQGITIHAGETKSSGPLSGADSVREAIKLGWDKNTPLRIGHGIQAANDKALIEEINAKNIGLEMCPKSNVQTEAIDWYSDHPAPELSRQGVQVSISPDNQTVSKTDPTNEFVKLHRYRQVDHEDRKRMVLSALATSFIMDPQKKAGLMKEVEDEFAHLEAKPKMALALYKEQVAIGKHPRLSFAVFDGLRLQAERANRINGQPVNMRLELGKLLGRPPSLLEYLPYQFNSWLQVGTQAVAELLRRFSELLSGPVPVKESAQ